MNAIGMPDSDPNYGRPVEITNGTMTIYGKFICWTSTHRDDGTDVSVAAVDANDGRVILFCLDEYRLRFTDVTAEQEAEE